MAGAIPHPQDPRCKYRSFKQRHGGQVPCMAIGQNLAGNAADEIGEITGITFQKVDTGILRPVLPNDDFSPLEWPNAPTQDAALRPGPNLALGAPPQAPLPIWQEFATTMLNTRDVMLTQMTAPAAARPLSLLKGMHKNEWLDGNMVSEFSETEIEVKTETIRNAIGANWSDNTSIEDWVDDIAGGLYGTTSFKELFNTLFPNSRIWGQQGLVCAPSETSKNGTIRNGVLHCLPFGYHELQRDESRSRDRARRRPEYLHNRILLRKELGRKARSRSRSPISSDDDLRRNVVDITQPAGLPAVPTLHQMLNNPANFVLKNDVYYKYFEPHKPDFLFYSMSTVESEEFAGVVRREYKVKLVVEICSHLKFGDEITLEKHIEYGTEQCVQQCVAGISLNQDSLYGLLVVVDGLKLVKLEKRPNPTSFFVSETDLVTWDQTQNMYALLQMIDNALQ